MDGFGYSFLEARMYANDYDRELGWAWAADRFDSLYVSRWGWVPGHLPSRVHVTSTKYGKQLLSQRTGIILKVKEPKFIFSNIHKHCSLKRQSLYYYNYDEHIRGHSICFIEKATLNTRDLQSTC